MEIIKVGKATLTTPEQLRAYHARIRPQVLRRLDEFRATWERGDEAVFEELVFCLLAAGASALMGLKGVETIRPVLWTASAEELAQLLHFHLYPMARASYIVAVREVVQNELQGRLSDWLAQFADHLSRRDACVQKFKGIGYKEASHFLRNIGFRGGEKLSFARCDPCENRRAFGTNGQAIRGVLHIAADMNSSRFAQ
ncbi:MAG: hypothetical protein BDTLLHRC_001224 [Candidatus Fervidibacter sp.]